MPFKQSKWELYFGGDCTCFKSGSTCCKKLDPLGRPTMPSTLKKELTKINNLQQQAPSLFFSLIIIIMGNEEAQCELWATVAWVPRRSALVWTPEARTRAWVEVSYAGTYFFMPTRARISSLSSTIFLELEVGWVSEGMRREMHWCLPWTYCCAEVCWWGSSLVALDAQINAIEEIEF